MKITLRKASALQNSIQEALRGIEVKLTVQLNEFEDPSAVLDRANADALTNDTRREALLKALYSVRTKVGQANAQAGVSDRLSTAAYIDKRISTLTAFLVENAVQDSMTVIQGQLDKFKNTEAKNRYLGYGDTVNTGVLVPEQVARFKAEQQELKKQKQKLNDEILELNVRTEIELAPGTVDVLTKEGLV